MTHSFIGKKQQLISGRGLQHLRWTLKIQTVPKPTLVHPCATLSWPLFCRSFALSWLTGWLADTLPNGDVALSHLEIVNFIITCFMHTLRTPNSKMGKSGLYYNICIFRYIYIRLFTYGMCVCVAADVLWMCEWHISGSQPESQHHFGHNLVLPVH